MNPLSLTLKPYVLIALAIAVLAVAGWIGYLTLQLHAQRADVANLTTQNRAAKAANDSNLATIAAQRTALKAWSDQAAKTAAEAAGAAQAVKALKSTLDATRAALAQRAAADHALPACIDLRSVDLAKVCPGTASALQQAAGAAP